jgi:hypothetical protein
VSAVSCRGDLRPSQSSRRSRSVLVDAVSWTLPVHPFFLASSAEAVVGLFSH